MFRSLPIPKDYEMTTTEEVIRLARSAGFLTRQRRSYTLERITRLIELVKAEENEACAKVCESKNPHPDQWSDMSEVAEQRAVTNCAEAIRARMKP